jgi:hypothetical protein
MFTSTLPGIPRFELPRSDEDYAALGFTDEETRIARDLHQHGFAVLDFPDDQIDDRIDRVKANLSAQFTGTDFSSTDSDKTQGERRIQDAWKFDPDVKAIAANAQMIALLTKLYGREAFPFQTLNFPVGTQQDAHTDQVHFSSLPEHFMCGVWLAMEDIGPDAGPLFYLPGSHRWPTVNNQAIGRKGFGSKAASAQEPYAQAWNELRIAYDAKEATFLARKGQALIWVANLLHGGSPQIDPKLTRWSQVTHYYFENCLYYTPAYSDEALGRLDLRNITSIHDGMSRPNIYLDETIAISSKVNLKTRVKRIFSR